MGDVILFPVGDHVRSGVPAVLRQVDALHQQLNQLSVQPGKSAEERRIELTGLHMRMARVRRVLPTLISMAPASHGSHGTLEPVPLADVCNEAAKRLDAVEATAWALCAQDVSTTAQIDVVHRLRIQAGELVGLCQVCG